MSGRIIHLSLSVRGALMNWSDREFQGVFSHPDGRPMTVHEAKNALMDELSKGHEVIPCSSDCDNFDFRKGCLGHPEPEPSGAEENNPND